MKKLVTFRIDEALLQRARSQADAENRTLTNFVETLLKRSIHVMESAEAPPSRQAGVQSPSAN